MSISNALAIQIEKELHSFCSIEEFDGGSTQVFCPVSLIERNDPSMSSTEWAERVAEEFEYSRADVRKAVKHFVKQMGQQFYSNLILCDRVAVVQKVRNSSDR